MTVENSMRFFKIAVLVYIFFPIKNIDDSGVPRLETNVRSTKFRDKRAHIPRPSGPRVLAILIPNTIEDRIMTILNMKTNNALLKKAII